MEVSVVIPNFNGIAFLDSVLGSLEGQTIKNFEVIFVDNGSSDGSCSFVAANYPWVHIIELPENFGFCRAVNEGIRASRAPYVLLLNNDTEVQPDFVEEMLLAIKRHRKAFSCGAKMVQYHVEELPYIEERYSRGLDTLTKNILHIWKIWISVTEPGSMDMRTGTPRKQWYIM